jgi:anionic cell wall polymer biosynthesis LytR-Cps2A-Psr (LCP) family protein
MGLDSRLDQHGQPLPQDIYDALHAGDETVGGYNANVLILLHFPSGDGPVTAVSIPRDDYVDIPGCPSGVCKGKIKQAYGNAYQQTMDSMDPTTGWVQPSRDRSASTV